MFSQWQLLGMTLVILVGALLLALLFHFAPLPVESLRAVANNIETILWWVVGISLIGLAIIYGVGKLIDRNREY
jgi:hypothetical protein